MLFWIVCAALAMAVAMLVAVPLLRRADADAPAATEIEIYRAQLAEIDRDIARGVITGEEAERTRTEVARRLLAADAAAPAALGDAPQSATLAMGGLTVALVIFGGIGLYTILGAVDQSGPYPDLPREARLAASAEMRASRPSQSEAMAAADIRRGPVEVADETREIAEQLRQVVAERPTEREAWEWLARVEAGMGKFEASIDALEQVVRLLPEGSEAQREALTRLLDQMVFWADGFVSPEAEMLIYLLLEEDERDLAARYYLGLLYYQTDRPDLAFGLWRAVIAEGPQQSGHVRLARQFVEDAAFRAGAEYSLPPLRTALDPETEAMARGMVAQLSDRLAAEGGPATDWARLITSLGVLGEVEQASAILAEARGVFGASPEDAAVIEQAATEAGLP